MWKCTLEGRLHIIATYEIIIVASYIFFPNFRLLNKGEEVWTLLIWAGVMVVKKMIKKIRLFNL